MRLHKSLRMVRRLGRSVAIAAAILLVVWVVVLAVSKEPANAMKALLVGSISRINRFGNWMEESITLTFAGLAVCLVFQANQFSIGAEGQLYLGALAAGTVGLALSGLAKPIHTALAFCAAGAAGFIWGAIPGFLKAHYRANEIVTTLMLNNIAIQIYNFILIRYLKPPTAGYPVSRYLPASALFPKIIPGTRVSLTLILSIAAVVVLYYMLYRSTFGYEIRMVGLNERYAHYIGVDVKRIIVLSMAASGVLAGLAGACLVQGVHRRLIIGISPGYGFDGILVSLLARNNPVAIPFAALFYGYLRTGADVMESNSDVARELVVIIQALTILLVTARTLVPPFMRRERGKVQ